MKKFTAILFLSTILLSTTELCQLLKLPQLVSHYIEHRRQNSEMNLLRFLAIHYTQGDVKDADYEQDMKLPFKTCDCTAHVAVFVCLPGQQHTLVPAPEFAAEPEYAVASNAFYPQLYAATIWQPPRVS